MKLFRKFLCAAFTAILVLTMMPVSALSASKPAAPKNLSYTSTASSVTVKWGKVSGATGYAVYQYNSSSKKSSKVKGTKSTSLKISNLKSATIYTYYVKAYKKSGSKYIYSAGSSKIKTATKPEKPTSFKVSETTKSSVTLKWKKVTRASGYTVYRYDKTSGSSKKIKNTTSLSCKISGLNSATAYTYYVKAYKKSGSKYIYSAGSSKIKTATKPEKPTSFKASATTKSSVTLQWDKVTRASGYTVYRYDMTSGSSEKIKNTTSLNCKISDLDPATAYTYYVKAYKTVDSSKVYSSASSKVTAVTNPNAPTGLSATSTTTSSITLKWDKVTGASGYTVYNYENGKSSAVSTVTTNRAVISGLSASAQFTYYVKAYVTSGSSKIYSAASSNVTAATCPTQVTGLSVTDNTWDSVSLEWSAVSGATGYEVQYSSQSSFPASTTKTVSVSDSSCKVTGLDSDVIYYFRVRAYKTAGGVNFYGSNSGFVNRKTNCDDQVTRIDTSSTHQTMKGFGASAAWWAQKVGGWSNAEEILSLLWGDEEGIGLNIYRYNLGAGSEDDEAIYETGKRTESFLCQDDDGNLYYDWTKDQNAQNCLSIADDLCDDLNVTLFCNSAPVFYTKNGKAYGDAQEDGTAYSSNFSVTEENCNAFAEYCYTCTDHFISQGYLVTNISPVNEPEWSWRGWFNSDGSTSMNQEGCYYTPEECASLYQAFINKLDEYEFSDTVKLDMFESGQIGGFGSSFAQYTGTILSDSINQNYFDTISAHSYWADKSAKEKCSDYLNQYFPGLEYAVTEYCQMESDESGILYSNSNGMTMDFGLALARVIMEDLTILNAVEWDWWTAVSNGVYADGLIYINDSDQSYETSKRLWCLGNFSKFIEAGAVRVEADSASENLQTCSFVNPDGSLVVVYVNESSDNETVYVECDGCSTFTTYVTSDTKNLEQNQKGSYSAKSGISVPAESVTTVVLK